MVQVQWRERQPNDNALVAVGTVGAGVEVCRIYHNMAWQDHRLTLMVDLPGAPKKSMHEDMEAAQSAAQGRVRQWFKQATRGGATL